MTDLGSVPAVAEFYKPILKRFVYLFVEVQTILSLKEKEGKKWTIVWSPNLNLSRVARRFLKTKFKAERQTKKRQLTAVKP